MLSSYVTPLPRFGQSAFPSPEGAFPYMRIAGPSSQCDGSLLDTLNLEMSVLPFQWPTLLSTRCRHLYKVSKRHRPCGGGYVIRIFPTVGIFVLIILLFAVLLPHLVGLLLAFLLLLVLIFAFVCHFLVAPSGSRGHNVTDPAGHSILPCVLCRCSSVDRLNTPFIVLFTLFGLPRHLLIPNLGPCYRNLTLHARSLVLARTFQRS
ncbi:hypothetical protein BKA93DRAFT_572039 [Sparassis latifolia]